jgi:2-phospho-L-lactate guanylyltransferase
MDPYVIIPVKPFAEAKQRLSPTLNSIQRAQLAERMFRHVFGVASTVFGAQSVLVVSRSREVLAMAETEGAFALLESGPPDLNLALLQAAQFASPRGHSELLIVASDLPLLGKDDLVEMITKVCVIAPDRYKSGTNALLWPAHLSFHFGENSFERHRAIAETAGLAPAIFVRQGLAHDVDVPEDLIALDP